jgi:hypothetical protein
MAEKKKEEEAAAAGEKGELGWELIVDQDSGFEFH